MMPYNPVKTIPSQVVIEAEEEEEEGENRKSAIIVKCTTNNSSELTADETAAASSLLLECWQPSLIKQIAHTTILAGSNKIRKCWHWSPVASASSVMSAILLYSLGRQGRQIRQRRLRRRSRCRCRKRKCLPLLSITNANKMTNITCCNLDSSSSCQDNNNNQNNKNNNNNESECSSLVQRKQPNSLRDQQQQQQQQELLWLEQQNNRKLHTQTKSLQCLWYTAFLLVIFLSLPSVSYMLPQDSFSTITKTSSILKGLTTNSLPKSLNLSPLHSSSLSAASTTSTSTSSSLSSYILLPTTTTNNRRRRRRTGRIMQDATSATNSAEFLQSTLHSNGQQLRQLRMQSQLKARTATQSRSSYDVQRIVRSAYAEANTDDANVSNGSTMNFSANLDNNNSNNKNHNNNIECPSYNENSVCPCYKFEDGLFLECPGTTSTSLRTTLERISSPIHSLSIYDFDRSVTSLSQDVFQPGVNIRHLQFSHSHLEALKDNSLKHVRASLESLSIVNGKLMQVWY